MNLELHHHTAVLASVNSIQYYFIQSISQPPQKNNFLYDSTELECVILQFKLDEDHWQTLGLLQVLSYQRKKILLPWTFLGCFLWSSHMTPSSGSIAISLKKTNNNHINIVSLICQLPSFPICRVAISRQHLMVAECFEILGWQMPKSTVFFWSCDRMDFTYTTLFGEVC